VYGAAGGTGRVLACIQGPPRRQTRCARRRSHGEDQQCAVRLSRRCAAAAATSAPPSSTPKRYTYIESGTPSRCFTRSAARIYAAPLAPASKQHEAPSVQVSMVEISRLPKVTATFDRYLRSPCTRLARYSSLGEQRRDVSSDVPSTADERYTGSPSSPPHIR
jgi:hypothetical protein